MSIVDGAAAQGTATGEQAAAVHEGLRPPQRRGGIRVGPQHARKFAAKLGAMGKPYLFYEVIEGGHGAGANLRESAHTSALEWTYFIRKLMD